MDGVRTMRQKTREQRRKLMRKQKLYGLVFVLLSIFVVIMCMTGKTAEDRDATAIVLLLPFGLYLIFTKKICIETSLPWRGWALLPLWLIPVDEQRKV